MVTKSYIKIKVEGKWMPYSEADWVIFNADKFPVGFMHVEIGHLKGPTEGAPRLEREPDPAAAFEDFWTWEPEVKAVDKALAGYTIELVGPARLKELLARHLDRAGKTHEGTGRQVEQLELPIETPETNG